MSALPHHTDEAIARSESLGSAANGLPEADAAARSASIAMKLDLAKEINLLLDARLGEDRGGSRGAEILLLAVKARYGGLVKDFLWR